MREVGGEDAVRRARSARDFLDGLVFSGRVGRESVDRDDDGESERTHVFDVLREIRPAAADRVDVLAGEHVVERFAHHRLADTRVHLERADRGDEDARRGLESRLEALHMDELFGAHVGAESRLGEDVIGHLERDPVRENRRVAVSDVREGPRVHEGRNTFARLSEIRLDRVA